MDEFIPCDNKTAREIAIYQTSGSAAKDLFEWENADTDVTLPSREHNKKKVRSHQAKLRKKLLDIQQQNKHKENVEKATVDKEQRKMRILKERQFGNIKSKVFDSTVYSASSKSESTVSSSTESFSLYSESSSNGKQGNKGLKGKVMISDIRLVGNGRENMHLHKNFGKGIFT